jgi:hypothetical protein
MLHPWKLWKPWRQWRSECEDDFGGDCKMSIFYTCNLS